MTGSDPRQYHLDFFEEHLALLDLAGRRVLEVGCGYGEVMQLVLDQHPDVDAIVGINSPERLEVKLPRKASVHVMDVTSLEWSNESFDIAYSLATFEHIHDLGLALAELARVLRPGSRLIAKWSPIWNGFDGHHYGPALSDPSHRPIELPWAHLIFDRETFPAYLARGEGFDDDEARSAMAAVYESPWLNRLTVDDYRRVIGASDFEVERLDAVRVELGGLLGRVAVKVSAGLVDAERVAAFFRRTSEEKLLVHKMIVHLRKRRT